MLYNMKKLFFIICLIFIYIAYSIAHPKRDRVDLKYTISAKMSYKGQSYDTYIVDYPHKMIKMYWKDADNDNLLSINNLKTMLEKRGEVLPFRN